MKALVLGGTQFVGRHIVQSLLAGGHTVSTLNRGHAPDDLPTQVERLRGDRDAGAAGLAALTGRAWDVCVDVSGYTPRQVGASAGKLFASVGRYVFVSAVSVYGDPVQRPVVESQPRMAPAAAGVDDVNGDTYGPLKVACENVVQQLYGDRGTLLRPQVVVGPHDPTDRFAYWVQRATRGGEMLAPGDGTDHLQVVDVRDLAAFVRTVAENNLAGSYNLAGPRLGWSEFMTLLGADNLVWVAADIIQAAGLDFLELPLFRPERGARAALMDVSNARARAAGLVLTDSAVTIQDVRDWSRGRGSPGGLSAEREAALIQHARTASPETSSLRAKPVTMPGQATELPLHRS